MLMHEPGLSSRPWSANIFRYTRRTLTEPGGDSLYFAYSIYMLITSYERASALSSLSMLSRAEKERLLTGKKILARLSRILMITPNEEGLLRDYFQNVFLISSSYSLRRSRPKKSNKSGFFFFLKKTRAKKSWLLVTCPLSWCLIFLSFSPSKSATLLKRVKIMKNDEIISLSCYVTRNSKSNFWELFCAVCVSVRECGFKGCCFWDLRVKSTVTCKKSIWYIMNLETIIFLNLRHVNMKFPISLSVSNLINVVQDFTNLFFV